MQASAKIVAAAVALAVVVGVGRGVARADDDLEPGTPAPRAATTGEIDAQVGFAHGNRSGVGTGFGGSFDRWVSETVAVGGHADVLAGSFGRQLGLVGPHVELITAHVFAGLDAGFAVQHASGAVKVGGGGSLRVGALIEGFELGVAVTGADTPGATDPFTAITLIVGYRDR